MSIRPIILCGGSGSRLWPESRENFPKQFLNLFQDSSLLEETLKRVKEVKHFNNPIIVTSIKYGFLIKKIMKKINFRATLLFEPISRNTTASIYLAALFAKKNEKLFIIPSDHYFENMSDFQNIIENAIYANQNNWTIFGIKATTPNTNYGYIKIKDNLNAKGLEFFNKSYDVEKFLEKPNLNEANEFIKQNCYFWNLGIFYVKKNIALETIKYHSPETARFCDLSFKKSIFSSKYNELQLDENDFKKIPNNSIDYEVIEKLENIKMIPLNIIWNDLGDWDTILQTKNIKQTKNKIFEVFSKNNFIRSTNRIIASIGLENFIIIDTEDALLVCKKNYASKIKEIVKKINLKNYSETKSHRKEYRPWGFYKVLIDRKEVKVKELYIEPNHRISLQYHNHRSEHWVIVSGEATIFIEDKIKILKKGDSIDIPVKAKHYIQNKTNKELVLIETQLGDYFGEDDIIRIYDPYNR